MKKKWYFIRETKIKKVCEYKTDLANKNEKVLHPEKIKDSNHYENIYQFKIHVKSRYKQWEILNNQNLKR